MESFSKEKSEFQKTGEFNYTFDEGGNVVFNVLSTSFYEKYFSIPLKNYVYDKSNIKSFNSIEFTEFVPVQSNTESVDVNEFQSENENLRKQLSDMMNRMDNSITEAERMSYKRTIIDLRISLKQGFSDVDFSEEFPYLPIKKNRENI